MKSCTFRCPSCKGKGKVYWNFGHSSDLCPNCIGKGYVSLEETIRDQIRHRLHSDGIVLGNDSATKSKPVPCKECYGKGTTYWDYGRSSGKCYSCNGTGYISLEEAMRSRLRRLGYSGEELEIAMKEVFVD